MRIAIIAPPWLPVPPPGYGGTEVVLDGLARGLVDLGHDVLLIGHPDSKCVVKRLSIVPAEDAQPMAEPCPNWNTRSAPTRRLTTTT